MPKVLITNAQLRKALATVRSLGKKGIETYVIEETRFSPTSFSKYCSQSMVCPSAAEEPEHYYRFVSEKIKEYGIDVFLPIDDDTVAVAMAHKDELTKVCSVPLPDYESYQIALNKGRSYKHAISVGVSLPKTVFPDGEESIEKLTEHLTYPLMVKAVKSSGGRGIKIAFSKEELLNTYLEVHKQYPFPVIQEHLGEGEIYEVALLYNSHHELRASFIQKHVRKFPLITGPSIVQESVIYPEILEMAIKFMQGLKWYGIASLEFMKQKDTGEIKFIEINGRFWNSIQMAIFAGVDFPWLLFQIAYNGDIKPVTNYQTGMLCRNLLPGDIFHYIFNKERKQMNPPFWTKSDTFQDDIISKDDPLPTIGFMAACLRYMFDKKMWRFLLRR
ncbi:MAG: D-alanine--D-alanine ligase [Candidatus Dichloromethanomonas elyunquensis]|nr:MAG: D-alanine--D-alanine ligase [Candidatus Dichloromethanomonas elyunquensis]